MSTRANEPMVFGATSEEPCMCGLFACFGDIWMKKPMTGGIDGQVQTRTVGEGIAESGSNRILPDERISSQVLGVGGSTLMGSLSRKAPPPLKVEGSEFLSEKCNLYCPICMCYWPELFLTLCCKHHVCAICISQILAHHESGNEGGTLAQSLSCPHCNQNAVQLAPIKATDSCRRYEDSPASTLCMSNGLKYGPSISSSSMPQSSPLKIGDTYESMMRKMLTYDQCGIRIRKQSEHDSDSGSSNAGKFLQMSTLMTRSDIIPLPHPEDAGDSESPKTGRGDADDILPGSTGTHSGGMSVGRPPLPGIPLSATRHSPETDVFAADAMQAGAHASEAFGAYERDEAAASPADCSERFTELTSVHGSPVEHPQREVSRNSLDGYRWSGLFQGNVGNAEGEEDCLGMSGRAQAYLHEDESYQGKEAAWDRIEQRDRRGEGVGREEQKKWEGGAVGGAVVPGGEWGHESAAQADAVEDLIEAGAAQGKGSERFEKVVATAP